eukprot:8532747-Pyramimonas_sp.AAC.1
MGTKSKCSNDITTCQTCVEQGVLKRQTLPRSQPSLTSANVFGHILPVFAPVTRATLLSANTRVTPRDFTRARGLRVAIARRAGVAGASVPVCERSILMRVATLDHTTIRRCDTEP